MIRVMTAIWPTGLRTMSPNTRLDAKGVGRAGQALTTARGLGAARAKRVST